MTVVDRDPQHLPVPLGGTVPVRLSRRRRRHLLARHAGTATVVVTALMTTVGLALLAAPPGVAAYLDASGLHVGGMTLRAAGPDASGRATVYASAQATLVLAEPGGGVATAAAAWQQGGTMRSASCALHTAQRRLVDECTFHLSPTPLTSVDVLDLDAGGWWQRTYSDGVRVSIGVDPDGAVVPVPFPVGR